MADFVGITVEGVLPLSRKLKRLAGREVQRRANGRIAEYIVEQFRKVPRKKRVTRKEAYGKTFFSDKQRRFFFSALASGAIKVPRRRTGRMRRAWRILEFKPSDWLIVNETPYAIHVQGENQSRMMKIIGWKRAIDIGDDRRVVDRAERIYNEEIRREWES